MLNTYQLNVIYAFVPWLIFPAVVSASYYLFSPAGAPVRRLLASSHGLVLVLAAAYAVVVSPWTGLDKDLTRALIWPFYGLLALFPILVGYSFVRYQGDWGIHMLQLMQIPCAPLVWFIGTMAITHDWL